MSGGSTANNSWTILTSEETVAETLKPLAGGADHDEESHTSSTGSGDNNPPVNGAEAAEALPVEDNTVSEVQTEVLNGDSSTDLHTAESIAVTDDPIKSSLEAPVSAIHSGDEVSQTQVLPEEPAQFSPDPDSFSDSYTHVTSSPDEPPPSVLSVETLGGAEFSPEEENLSQEGMLHPLNGEKLHQEGEESDFYLRTSDSGKQAEPVTDPEVVDTTTREEEPEVRRRRSLLAALEQIGQREEEEAEEEEFKLPEREEDSGFSVNKCILGALILLGLGTIFFSGVFMDLEEESDYSLRELRDAAVPGKQEWPNPEVPPPPPPIAADNSELLNKLAEGNEQISVLQAQLQAQKEELKVAKGHEAEGVKERLRWEEVEKENSRLKTEMASLLVLQKENERMKKELEAIPALQKEVETLRSTVTELKLSSAADQSGQAPVKSTSPPSGQPEDSRPETAGSVGAQAGKEKKRDKYDMGEKKDWKEKEKYVRKDEDKSEHIDGGKTERKRGKHEFDKQKEREGKEKRHSEESKPWKEKERKKDKDKRGDEGKPWKNREGKKERKEKSDHGEVKEEKDRKKGKFEKVKEGKQWRSKEENKDWKRGKDHGERHKSKEEWKGEKEWKKVKNGYNGSGKERKDWKEKGEKKEWKNGNGKDHYKEGRGERKQWEGGKSKERKDEKKSRNGKYDKEWKRKDEKWEDKKKDKSTHDKNYATGRHGHKEEHRYGDRKPPHSHSKPSVGQPEYWIHQRDRLHHNPKPPQLCDSVESCAKAERLLPVSFTEFQAFLLTYLTKAEQAGVEKSKIEELQKLTPDFFKDGLFVHDQTSFQDFVEDLGDILEDMVEGDEEAEGEEEEVDEEEPDSALEEDMEGFKREVLKKFALAVAGEKEKPVKGEWRKESGQGRG